jgi:hypothetical protein
VFLGTRVKFCLLAKKKSKERKKKQRKATEKKGEKQSGLCYRLSLSYILEHLSAD